MQSSDLLSPLARSIVVSLIIHPVYKLIWAASLSAASLMCWRIVLGVFCSSCCCFYYLWRLNGRGIEFDWDWDQAGGMKIAGRDLISISFEQWAVLTSKLITSDNVNRARAFYCQVPVSRQTINHILPAWRRRKFRELQVGRKKVVLFIKAKTKPTQRHPIASALIWLNRFIER